MLDCDVMNLAVCLWNSAVSRQIQKKIASLSTVCAGINIRTARPL